MRALHHRRRAFHRRATSLLAGKSSLLPRRLSNQLPAPPGQRISAPPSVATRLSRATRVGFDLDQGEPCCDWRRWCSGEPSRSRRLRAIELRSGTQMKYGTEIVGVSLATFLALLGAAFAARRSCSAQHMWVLFFVLLGSVVVLLRKTSFAPRGSRSTTVRLHGRADPLRRRSPPCSGASSGLLVGVVIALQLAFPDLNIEPWFNFGRLRPLHTSAVIFAFGGNALIATSFYVVQRTCRARLFGGNLAWFVFWGYQLFIVMAATGYLLGITESREYAEPEWYVDLWLTVVWVAYLVVFLGTILQAQGAAHLRRQLVLPVLHRHHRDAARRQQSGDAGVVPRLEELLAVLRRAGCADPVVVRPQRGRLLPHRRLPRHDVLLRAEAGRTGRSIPTGCRSSTSGR